MEDHTMDGTKYFIPSIEDIRVGYECEILWNQDIFPEDNWYKIVVGEDETKDFDLIDWVGRVANSKVRTPYLTKKQIQNEGWEFTGKTIDLWFKKEGEFNMGSWTSCKIIMHYGPHDKRLYIDAIDTGESTPIFRGTCKDVNELRFITKLINIENT